jgi:hypothetical protein
VKAPHNADFYFFARQVSASEHKCVMALFNPAGVEKVLRSKNQLASICANEEGKISL